MDEKEFDEKVRVALQQMVESVLSAPTDYLGPVTLSLKVNQVEANAVMDFLKIVRREATRHWKERQEEGK